MHPFSMTFLPLCHSGIYPPYPSSGELVSGSFSAPPFYLRFLFFHPDYTVGFGIAPNHAPCARGLYRRSGITPCPEDIVILLSFIICIAL